MNDRSRDDFGLLAVTDARRRRSGRLATVRRAACTVAVLSALLAVSACSGSSGGGTSGKGGSTGSQLNVALSEEPPTLDPCQDSQSSTGLVVRSNIVEGLTKRDPVNGSVNPALALSWSQSGANTWVFKLRPSVQFQDGTAFDANAVKFSVDRALNPALECEVAGQFFDNSKMAIKVVDPMTISFTTTAPDPILPLRLSFIGIVPTSSTATGKDNDPIGTGPYQLVKWDHGVSLTLKRFDKYWDKAPDYANVKYVFRSDPTVRTSMIRNGEADIAQDLDPQTSSDIGVQYNSNQIPFLRLDPTKAPTSDLRIRQAISYAIDVNGLLKSVFQGSGKAASQLVPPSAIGYNASLQPWPYDPAKAKALVNEAKAAGTPIDKQILLVGRTGLYANADKLMAVVQNELQAIGLNAAVKMMDVNAWLGYQRRPFSSATGPVILQSEHGNQGGDASFTMANNYGSTGLVSSYGTPELDAMIAKAQTLSGDARQQAYAACAAYIQKEVRDVPLIQAGGVIGESKKVSYQPNESSGDELDLAAVHPRS